MHLRLGVAMAEPSGWLGGWAQLLSLLLHRLAPICTVLLHLHWGVRKSQGPAPIPAPLPLGVGTHLDWAACLGSLGPAGAGLPPLGPCQTGRPTAPPGPHQPAEGKRERET